MERKNRYSRKEVERLWLEDFTEEQEELEDPEQEGLDFKKRGKAISPSLLEIFMQCTHPVKLVKNIVNHAGIFVGISSQIVPCGRCIACRLNYANSWSTRIVSEAKQWKFASFVTLTYNDENIPINDLGYQTLSKRDCQLFFKRARKDVSFRYFLGGEYGDTWRRPHYHFCCFSDNEAITDLSFWEKHWRKGFVYIGSLTRDSANYVAKYCVKKLGGKASEFYSERGIEPEFALMSRRPGIGYDYITKFREMVKNNGFVVVDGKKQSIPKYFGSKIFTDDEKNQRFLENSAKAIEDFYNDFDEGYGYDYDLQKNRQREYNIKSRLKKKKL